MGMKLQTIFGLIPEHNSCDVTRIVVGRCHGRCGAKVGIVNRHVYRLHAARALSDHVAAYLRECTH